MIMQPPRIIRGHGLRTHSFPIIVLLATLYFGARPTVRAQSQTQPPSQHVSSKLLVIQGLITGIKGDSVMVKVPDSYPRGGPGIHAQYVIRGPSYSVDVSGAKLLCPDGKQTDRLPLAVGDRVLMVLTMTENEAGPLPYNALPKAKRPYSASIIERLAPNDTVATH